MPLFDRYDVSVEFNRRMGYVQRSLSGSSAQYARLPDEAIVDSLFNVCEICPIEIFSGDATLVEQPRAQSSDFELSVPYRGDDELWHLYPSKLLEGILGEIFRGQLILTAIASSEATVRGQFERRLAGIEIVLGQLAERVRLFEEMVPSLIQAEALKMRCGAMGKFTGLQH